MTRLGPAISLLPRADPVRDALALVREEGAFRGELELAWKGWSSLPSPILEASLRRTHYRPHQGARLVGEARFRPPGSDHLVGRQFYSVHAYPEAAKAHQRLAEYLRKPALPCFGPPVHVVEAWNAVIFALPNGPRLRKLAWFLDPEAFAHLIEIKNLPRPEEEVPGASIEVLRYVPRKRALLRYPVATTAGPSHVYVKIYTKTDHPLARNNHRRLVKAGERGRLAFRPPEVLGSSAKRRALFLGELPGTLLSDLYDPGQASALRAAGAAIASLHGSRIAAGTVWSAAEEFDALLRAMDALRLALEGVDPALEELLEELETRLPRASSFEPRPTHANLFGDQILVSPDGVGIVDWDDLAAGDPCFDMGRLAAHVLYLCGAEAGTERERADQVIAHLLAGYRAFAGTSLDPDRIAWHVATGLLMRAKISALRPLPESWIGDVTRSIVLAREVLHHGLPALE